MRRLLSHSICKDFLSWKGNIKNQSFRWYFLTSVKLLRTTLNVNLLCIYHHPVKAPHVQQMTHSRQKFWNPTKRYCPCWMKNCDTSTLNFLGKSGRISIIELVEDIDFGLNDDVASDCTWFSFFIPESSPITVSFASMHNCNQICTIVMLIIVIASFCKFPSISRLYNLFPPCYKMIPVDVGKFRACWTAMIQNLLIGVCKCRLASV